MKTNLLTLAGAITMVVSSGYSQITVASDNADNAAYAPQPTHNWSPINGGFGFNTWTSLTDTSGGGTFMDGVGVNSRQVDGNFSFALYGGSGSYDVSRALTASLAAGTFSIVTRFDIAGVGPNLVNLRTGNTLTSFGSGELLSFGIVGGNQLSYTDSTGFHLLSSGEARGAVWDWDVTFNALLGSYTLSVTNLGGGYATTVSGSLDASATTVGSFAVINSSGPAGGGQNLVFDIPVFTVPEPSTMVLGAAGLATLLLLKRRR